MSEPRRTTTTINAGLLAAINEFKSAAERLARSYENTRSSSSTVDQKIAQFGAAYRQFAAAIDATKWPTDLATEAHTVSNIANAIANIYSINDLSGVEPLRSQFARFERSLGAHLGIDVPCPGPMPATQSEQTQTAFDNKKQVAPVDVQRQPTIPVEA